MTAHGQTPYEGRGEGETLSRFCLCLFLGEEDGLSGSCSTSLDNRYNRGINKVYNKEGESTHPIVRPLDFAAGAAFFSLPDWFPSASPALAFAVEGLRKVKNLNIITII